MKPFRFLYLLILFVTLSTSCDQKLEKVKPKISSDADSIWKKLYLTKDLDGQRIALFGYINTDHLVMRGDEMFVTLSNHQNEHLMHLTIPKKSKNSLDIIENNETKTNNIEYFDYDEENSAILDNEGHKLPLKSLVCLSFDIKYAKHKDTGEYPLVEVLKDGDNPFFEKYSKQGEKYYTFYVQNIRIDAVQ